MLSENPDIGAALRSIRLSFTSPVAQGLTGEIAPFRVDSLGVERPFSLYVRPQFDRRDPGFDQLLLVAPADMALGFAGLYAGQAGDELEVEGVEVIPTGVDSLRLSFAEIRPNTDVEVVRLDFRTDAFWHGGGVARVLTAQCRGRGHLAAGGSRQRAR